MELNSLKILKDKVNRRRANVSSKWAILFPGESYDQIHKSNSVWSSVQVYVPVTQIISLSPFLTWSWMQLEILYYNVTV